MSAWVGVTVAFLVVGAAGAAPDLSSRSSRWRTKRRLVALSGWPLPADRSSTVSAATSALSASRSAVTQMVVRAQRSSSARAYERRLPVGLEAVARALRAGTPLSAAMHEASGTVGGPVGDDFARVARELDQGRSTAAALQHWLDDRPLGGVRLSVTALVVGTELGGSRARAVDRVAVGLRDRAASAREVQALASQARLSAVVIALAPVVFAFLGVSGNQAMAGFLLATPLGWACLLGGATLDGAAACWMARIVRRAAA